MWLSPVLILLLYNVDGEKKELLESTRIQDDGNGVKLTELGDNEEEEHNTAVVRSGPEKHEVNGCIYVMLSLSHIIGVGTMGALGAGAPLCFLIVT